MNLQRYTRTLLFGLVILAVAIATAWSFRRGGPEGESIPAEEWHESAEEVSEAEGVPEAAGEAAGEVTWDLPVAYNQRVAYWIDFLKGRNYDRTRLWLERKGRYEPMIRAKLRERGMPEDLIYLAMIESGFSPRAYSRARAAGIWQFISETGRRYGLEVSSHVDERRDPIKATDAALDYLQKLYRQFGSWYLAAAAYNTGEGRVERILRQRAGGARGDDALFWKIDQYLPRETRDYVPLMLAAAHIGKEPEKYGFHGLQLQTPMRFDAVQVPGGTSLAVVARAAGVDPKEIQQLNPHLVRRATPPNRSWPVRIPAGLQEQVARNFTRVHQEERLAAAESSRIRPVAGGRLHTVRRGETLSHIAKRYGTTVREIQVANGGLRPHRVRAGQRLVVPSRGETGARVAAGSSTAPSGGSWKIHRVRRGDTLWAIARRNGATVQELRAWNNLGRRSKIVPGQRLRIRS